MPRLREQDIRVYQREPKFIEEDFFSEKNNVDPQDISYNFIPYKMDSDFERNALEEMVKMSELRNLEVYFNGYKDTNLQTFWIQTPVGVYTPDFLILKRKDKKIGKILIVETKGKSFYDEDFKIKEKFMLDVFTKFNPHVSYRCFVDEGKNDFSVHIKELKKVIEMM
jgi:restriction endonuclease